MKIIRLIAVLAICMSSMSIAQAQDVVYSPYEKFDFRGGDFFVVGKIGGRIYAYRGSVEGYFLDAYNDSMERVATVVLDFFPPKIYDVRFIPYANQIIVLYQGIEGNKITLYGALLDGTGRLKKTPVVLDNAKTGLFGPTRTYFSYAFSEDKKYVVAFSARDKGKVFEFEGKWIDDQLNVVQRSKASYKADNDVQHGEAMVGNDGNVYLPLYTPVGTKQYSDQAWLLSLKQNDTKFTTIQLPLSKAYAASLFMKVDNVNNRIYAGGFYSEKKAGSYQGVLFGYYDMAGGQFQNVKTIAFDEKLINETAQHNKKHAFDNYQVKQIIVKNDGGFVMLSEEYFINARTSYTPGFGTYSFYYNPYMSQSIREYHYDDVMALSYDGQGNRQWDAFIYKNQYSIEDGGLFSSYILLNTGGSLGFLYNDFRENGSGVQLATIDGDGKVNGHSFGASGGDNPDWMPRSGKQVSAREIVVPCLHKKQICFAKVIF
ncbi:MAG: hypothetical protein H0X33_01735 [Taibaiella sp.]|nr:hypothetical protein [Taibaiella sp.]